MSSLQKIEEVRSQLSQALLPASCENSYTVGRLLGSGTDHIVILAWKKPEGECRDSPQHLIPRVMRFIRRGSPTVTSKGLAEELHNRWKLSVHPHMLKLGDVFPTPDYLVIGMEYANAKSLERSLSMQHHSRGTCALPYPLAIFFFQQLVLTMEFCHQNGVHFRGLQPKHVLISRDKQGNPLVKLGAGGFHNANDQTPEGSVLDESAEADWRANALYAPPEDLEHWLKKLGLSMPRHASGPCSGAHRMTRHHSHTYTPPHHLVFNGLVAARRQHSMPTPDHTHSSARRPTVLRQRSRQDDAQDGIRSPSATRMHVGAPQPPRSSSSRGSSRSSAERAARSTQHAQRTVAERDGSESQRMERLNSARVAAAAAAAAASFGSKIDLPEADQDATQSTHSMPRSTAAAKIAASAPAKGEVTVGEDHTANMRRMHSASDRHTSPILSPLHPRSTKAGSPLAQRSENAQVKSAQQSDVVVFDRPSPFLPPMSEANPAPLNSPSHDSTARQAYPEHIQAPASEGSAFRRRTLQPVPSFKEWGTSLHSLHASGEDVDSSAASVWTAACILFEMLYGYHPFQMEPGEGIEEWAARVKSFDIKWPESVPETDEIRRALATMLCPHQRRASLAAVRNLAFFRRDLPEGAFDMTAHANARVGALRPHHVQDVLSRLRTLVDTCALPRPPTVELQSQLPGSLGGPFACCSAYSSGLLAASPASSA